MNLSYYTRIKKSDDNKIVFIVIVQFLTKHECAKKLHTNTFKTGTINRNLIDKIA